MNSHSFYVPASARTESLRAILYHDLTAARAEVDRLAAIVTERYKARVARRIIGPSRPQMGEGMAMELVMALLQFGLVELNVPA